MIKKGEEEKGSNTYFVWIESSVGIRGTGLLALLWYFFQKTNPTRTSVPSLERERERRKEGRKDGRKDRMKVGEGRSIHH